MTEKKGLKERRYLEQRGLRMDHILRRLHCNGLDSLATDELKFMERVAAELRFEFGWDSKDYEADYEAD